MNNADLARRLESEWALPENAPRVRVAPPPLGAAALPRVIVPAAPNAKARGLLQSLWARIFGPPRVDPCAATPDFSAFRALYEVGSDHLPSSGTWPASRDV